ncbi:hypothetical protein B5M09_002883 [Aphanomyces astaci]|uniref:RRM domain-containing protein n=1 Tax=Aphanomyces astaci TaxID=112090 RepID=A0A3R7W0B6_APHAT|nr:hypothetical protein B5M09_002883 [Aphanomyces astaci]
MVTTADSPAPAAPPAAETVPVDVSAMKNKKWMYVDAAGGQKGPMDEAVLKRLLRRGLVHGETYVWSPELPVAEWKMAKDIALFTPVCVLWQKVPQWHYYDHLKVQQGPISTADLVRKFEDGDVDGLTLVWSSCQVVATWTPMGEVSALKEELHEINLEREKEEAILATQQSLDPKLQTFHDDASSTRAIDKILDELEDLAEDRGDESAKPVKKAAPPASLSHSDILEAAALAAKTDGGGDDSTAPTIDTTNPKKRKKSKSKKTKWTSSKQKTWVYINGLPLDITIPEVHDHFVKCGVIQKDLHTDDPKIKLYRNKDTGQLSGDGAVCYMKEPSVELAIQLLDKSDIRPNCPIDVSVAVFSQKGESFVERKRVKLDNRAKVKKFEQEKALSWGAGGDEEFRIVVLKHMFKLDDFDEGDELKEDIKKECETLGDIAKITFFEKHPLGVVIVKYHDAEGAEACIDKMNNRWFAGQRIECSYWDGTNYVIKESDVEEAERTEAFGQWLEEGGSDDSDDDGDDGRNDGMHAGRRVLPDSDDEEDADGEEQVHAGRVLPDLDDD